ncbi:quorum-sensing system DWW-type pheromone [Streptococcus henryi]|jgi:hypothetical protein|nr:quorum-sensing system DWW-type pheromone [Streptococcus henryi]
MKKLKQYQLILLFAATVIVRTAVLLKDFDWWRIG